jgi:hypothetical protein
MTPDAPPTPVFVQSFRQGHTRVTEQSYEIDLDPANPTCKVRIKDSSGLNRYQVNCVAENAGTTTAEILGWHIRLVDLNHKIYSDVLMTSPNPAEDKTQIGWLDAGRFPKIPTKAPRIIKVDSFYCLMQVQELHFGHPPAPYLDRMVVNLKFSNSDPRPTLAIAAGQ